MKTGIQSLFKCSNRLDSGFRRNERKSGFSTFCDIIKIKSAGKIFDFPIDGWDAIYSVLEKISKA